MEMIHLENVDATYFPACGSQQKDCSVVVCPGGAYAVLSDFEGADVARFYSEQGFHAYTCAYGVGEAARMPQPVDQLARVVCEAHRRTRFVVVCGFSAGGHLCATLSTGWRETAQRLKLPMQAVRPDAAVLGYPLVRYPADMPLQPLAAFASVASQADPAGSLPDYFRPALIQTPRGPQLDFEGLSRRYILGEADTEEALHAISPVAHIDKETPPTFLWATMTDELVPYLHSVAYANALRQNGVRTALHLFSQGKHGEGLAQQNLESCRWPMLSVDWLRSIF